jgi:hypothetical protein
MAESRVIDVIKQVEKTVLVDVKEETVELTLSMDEAKTLATILTRVGGSPRYIRGHAESIHDSLVKTIGYYTASEPDQLKGHLVFKDINADDLELKKGIRVLY